MTQLRLTFLYEIIPNQPCRATRVTTTQWHILSWGVTTTRVMSTVIEDVKQLGAKDIDAMKIEVEALA